MYCRNCGHEMTEGEQICLKCGAKKNVGSSYCSNCGEQVDSNASVCVHCGTQFEQPQETKSKLVAGLLGIFLGGFVIHKFHEEATTL